MARQEAERFWNLDLYLAEILAKDLREFAVRTHSRPMNYTDEGWEDKLNSIATRLEAYHKNKFDFSLERELFITESAQEAIRELADIFPSLWD